MLRLKRLKGNKSMEEWVLAMQSAGIAEKKIQQVVARVDGDEPEQNGNGSGPAPELLTLAQASERFGITHNRLTKWVFRGHLPVRGRERFPAPGGGRVLVSAEEVKALVECPPKITGRPKKTA